MLPTSDYSSSSFWKGTLPAYRETDGGLDESEQAPSSGLHLFESDEEALIHNQGSNMSISASLAELNLPGPRLLAW